MANTVNAYIAYFENGALLFNELGQQLNTITQNLKKQERPTRDQFYNKSEAEPAAPQQSNNAIFGVSLSTVLQRSDEPGLLYFLFCSCL